MNIRKFLGLMALLGIPFGWGVNIATGSQYDINWDLPKGMKIGSPEHVALCNKLNMELLKNNGSHETQKPRTSSTKAGISPSDNANYLSKWKRIVKSGLTG